MPKAVLKYSPIPLELKTHTALPRYCERGRDGSLWFRVDRGPRVLLPSDPTTPEFHARYSVALVDAVAAESGYDD
jgi:hypothetical protein